MSERMIPLKIADMAVESCNKEIAKLQAENVSLKAEVERLTPLLGDIVPFNEYLEEKEHAERLHIENSILMKETARLKAELQRLRASSFVTAVPVEEYERLRKAGDALVDMVDWEVPYERRKKLEADWNAAKEGKQS